MHHKTTNILHKTQKLVHVFCYTVSVHWRHRQCHTYKRGWKRAEREVFVARSVPSINVATYWYSCCQMHLCSFLLLIISFVIFFPLIFFLSFFLSFLPCFSFSDAVWKIYRLVDWVRWNFDRNLMSLRPIKAPILIEALCHCGRSKHRFW